MDGRHQGWIASCGLRLCGTALIAIGALAAHVVFRRVQAEVGQDASPADMMIAALGFFGISLGAALAGLGTHIFDRIRVSDRWVTRTYRRPGRSR